MARNLKTPERIVRAIIGLVVLTLYGALDPPLRYLTLVGLIPLGTALSGRCPVYRAFGRVSVPSDSQRPSPQS